MWGGLIIFGSDTRQTYGTEKFFLGLLICSAPKIKCAGTKCGAIQNAYPLIFCINLLPDFWVLKMQTNTLWLAKFKKAINEESQGVCSLSGHLSNWMVTIHI